jgi:hypothetical protein
MTRQEVLVHGVSQGEYTVYPTEHYDRCEFHDAPATYDIAVKKYPSGYNWFFVCADCVVTEGK